MTQDTSTQHPSSYRDPSGFLFYQNGVLYRQVNQFFKEDYDRFISSGLYDHAVKKGWLIPHQTIQQNLSGTAEWYLTLQPEAIEFISYPYEWCFDMLKDAALLTLDAAIEAMEYGMMLKDASAYNVQWHHGKMIFIDTLSFEQYDEKKPWIAYRQFCEHFLAPLAVMHYLKMPLQNLVLAYPDGLPLPLIRKMLPLKSRFRLNDYIHLHLHGSVAQKTERVQQPSRPFSSQKLKTLLRSLKEAVQSYTLDQASGTWSGYYSEAANRQGYFEEKKQIVASWLAAQKFDSVIDLGANEGTFSMLAAERAGQVISADFDHYSVNRLYRETKNKKIKNILPLVIDLSQPSPAIGVNNEERSSFLQRAKSDLVLALALIHHLAIGKNIPFEKIAQLFLGAAKHLIIEFVPKEDEKVVVMLDQKRDVYHWYTREAFLTTFSNYFKIIESKEIGTSGRTLYLMQAYDV